MLFFFFFNDTATTEIYTLSLHDALPIFVSPDEATLLPEELVMGLEINGDARAYPVGMLRIREIVNDEVGGTPVLVTW